MIVVFGTVCLDRIRRIPELPRAGGYVEIEEEMVTLGGEAANTAVALRGWDREVWLCGNDFGVGPEADLIQSALALADVKWHPVGDRTARRTPPVCDIYVTPDGDRTMYGKGFRSMEPVFVPALVPMTPGQWFTAEPNMPAVSRQAARAAIAAGMKLYLMDFVGAEEPIAPGSVWQTSTDWVGCRSETFANIEWVRGFVAKHRCLTILTDGANGFVAGSPELPARAYPPFPGAAVVNSTGAGDVFRAGMLFGFSQDWAPVRCLQFAAAAGCLKCRASADSPVPHVSEIEQLIAANPDVAKHY